MKKLILSTLALLTALCLLTACSVTQSGAAAGKAESYEKTEEIMDALSENRITDVKSLLHPSAVEGSDSDILQMCNFLSGRKAMSMELRSINVNTSTGTAGKSKQEDVSYRVVLSDSNVIHLKVVYLSNGDGEGFSSIQLVLGVL